MHEECDEQTNLFSCSNLLAHCRLFRCSWLKSGRFGFCLLVCLFVCLLGVFVYVCGCVTGHGELGAVALPPLPGATGAPEAPVAGRGGTPVQASSSSVRAPLRAAFPQIPTRSGSKAASGAASDVFLTLFSHRIR